MWVILLYSNLHPCFQMKKDFSHTHGHRKTQTLWRKSWPKLFCLSVVFAETVRKLVFVSYALKKWRLFIGYPLVQRTYAMLKKSPNVAIDHSRTFHLPRKCGEKFRIIELLEGKSCNFLYFWAHPDWIVNHRHLIDEGKKLLLYSFLPFLFVFFGKFSTKTFSVFLGTPWHHQENFSNANISKLLSRIHTYDCWTQRNLFSRQIQTVWLKQCYSTTFFEIVYI